MTIAIVWFRQDLRLKDNPAFFQAGSEHQIVIPLYILDENSSSGEAQSWWLHHSLIALNKSLKKQGLNLVLRKGKPLEILLEIIKKHAVDAIYWNRCYEPLAIERDKKIKTTLLENGIEVESFNGNLFNEPWTIKNKSGEFFKVFTPYWNTCKQALLAQPEKQLAHRPSRIDVASDELEDWKLLPTLNWASRFPEFWTPGEEGAAEKLEQFIVQHLNDYKRNRDFPAENGTSHLSPHLHFGEISPWALLRTIEHLKLDPSYNLASIERFLSELGWREFSVYLLYHFPKLPSENFKDQFDAFPWQNNEQFLLRWQKGQTGYPLIDAGMRELWATGYMHNRVRMVVASFLTKGLLIDWRIGADWFLNALVDADLANNSASWQWVAGCGADAAPYFRIFNPVLQSQKFDPEGLYIRQWVPELSKIKGKSIHAPWENVETNYPPPMVDHNEARKKALSYYKQLKKTDAPGEDFEQN